MKGTGLVETKVLISLVTETDAMVRSADAQVDNRIDIGGGLVTVIVTGKTGSLRTTVDAHARVADQVGELVEAI